MSAATSSRWPRLALSWVLFVMCALVSGGGCSKHTPASGTVMRDNAFVVEQRAANVAIVHQTTLDFPLAGNEDLLSRNAGDVLVGRRQEAGTPGQNPSGFLRRVRSIATVDDRIVIETDHAALEDAFAQATWSSPSPAAPSFSPTSFSPPLRPRDLGDDPGVGDFDLEGDLPFVTGGVTGRVRPYGTLHLNPTYDEIHGRVSWSGLEEATFVVGGDIHASLGVDVDVDGDLAVSEEKEWELWSASKPLFIPDPPIEITAVIKIVLTCKVKAEVKKVHAHFGAELDVENVRLGLKYDRASGWQSVHDYDLAFHRIGPLIEAEGEAELQCSIGPKLTFLVYDLAGPFVSLFPYAKVALKVSPFCKLALSAGFGGKIGIEADIPFTHAPITGIGYELSFYEKPLWTGPDGNCLGSPDDGPGATAPPLALGQNHPSKVVADDTYAYWTTLGTAPGFADGGVYRVHLDGQDAAPTALATGQTHPTSVAIDDTYVYWTETAGCDDDALGRIRRARKDGSGATLLIDGLDRPFAIAVDGSGLYWTAGGGSPHGAVLHASKDGSGVRTLVHGLDTPLALAIDATSVYWTEYATGADESSKTTIGLTTDHGADGRVGVVRKDGTGLKFLAMGEPSPAGLAIDDTSVYWASASSATGGSIRMAPKNGSTPAATFVDGQNIPFGVALSTGDVYWTTTDAVVRMPKSKIGGAQRIAIGRKDPLSITLVPDATGASRFIVFSTGGTPTVDGYDLGDGEIDAFQIK